MNLTENKLKLDGGGMASGWGAHSVETRRGPQELKKPSLVPGAVLGDPDDGLINLVSDISLVERGEVAGYNARVSGQYRQLFPRISRLDFEARQLADLPEVPGVLDSMLTGIRGLTPQDRANFSSSRKLVEQVTGEGKRRWILVPRVPEAAGELDVLTYERVFGESAPEDLLAEVDLTSRRKKRNYTLAQIFTDDSVVAKYKLTRRESETAKRLAASDPVAAAALYQDIMNRRQSEVAVVVTAGLLTRDKVQAKNTIAQMCRFAARDEAMVSAAMSMDFVYLFGPEGESDWHVRAPLKYATEASYVYWFVRQEGAIFPSLLLGLELVLLGIDVFDGDSSAEPQLEFHAGLSDDEEEGGVQVGISAATSSLLSTADRVQLQTVQSRLLPITNSDGKQIANAVRVTGNYVLFNPHVIAVDPNCLVAGEKMQVRSQLARDLWSAKIVGDSDPWLLREPNVGELAVVCCVKDGSLVVSAPLRVTSVDPACVVTSLDESVKRGMSGGALVALGDMALLGIHSASTLHNLLSFRFGERQFTELLDTDSVSAVSRHDDEDGFAATVVERFKRKGTAGLLKAAVSTLKPVFQDGMHIGMLVRDGGDSYTPCDAEMNLTVGADRVSMKFETFGVPGLFRTSEGGEGRAPVYRRAPNYFEHVFVIGFDTDAYISNETAVVHIGPDARTFVLRDMPNLDKPVLGGLVMGWDGAVLGCCGPRSMTTAVGLGYVCWTLPKPTVVDRADRRALLRAAFPFLNMSVWSDSLLEEAFTHSSVGQYKFGGAFNAGNKPLANVGDAVARAELSKSLREHAIPHSAWSSYMQALQSNAKFSELAWELGYASGVGVGVGVSLQRNAKPYADLTEALIGAAALVEEPATVTMLCSVMGILYSPTVQHTV